ncbi:type I restriction enzyme, S subunit [Amycolatopsis marina]|uniref:Type I restriction enzyme, S subunit n=1 Tax=Amycolatopsis marina TaxID=490629 RepID=A0A1I0W7D4_9PSEU|nr:restriction endonuclease subunit S [Amycolatopsis marina]SFA84208.1 type I restriction enzyme, S subunit [Amycolatopsis marina]
MDEWAKLGNIAHFSNGKSASTTTRSGSYPVYGANGIIRTGGAINACAGVSIVGRVGSYCGVVHYSPQDCWVTDNAIIVTAKDGVDKRYLYYALSSNDLHSHRIGSGQPLLTQSILQGIGTVWRPLCEQRAIAGVLGALDDKIAVNERVSVTCDELRRIKFASCLGGSSALPQSNPLSSVAEFVNGRAFTKNATGTGRMVVRIAEVNSGPGSSTVYNDIDVPENHLARAGDILFAWSGSLTVARWFRSEAIVNQHIFKVIPKAGYPAWLVFELVRSKLGEFKRIAADKATTMGHIQRRHLDEAVPMPDPTDIEGLDRELGPLWDRALLAETENLVLAQIRDTLLPQLMSGAIRVKDAERLVEEAT